MLIPNILITNFCNQNCPFCFAAKEMGNTKIKREIPLTDFKKAVVEIARTTKGGAIKLLGGEPTLHSHFEEIIDFTLKHFSYIQIFTNGIFSDSVARFLEQKKASIGFTFNVMTPNFLSNKNVRSLVKKRVREMSKNAKITYSLTFDMHSDIKFVLKMIGPKYTTLADDFRLGFVNPIAGKKNTYIFAEFSKMGKQLYLITKLIRRNNLRAGIHLNCGFTRCMFTDKQFSYLKKEGVIIPGFGCFGKEASFDLQTDTSAFHCFSLSTRDKLSTKRKDFKKVDFMLLKKRFQYWNKFKQEVCIKCPFYGFDKDQCPGPCIAFLMNQSRKN